MSDEKMSDERCRLCLDEGELINVYDDGIMWREYIVRCIESCTGVQVNIFPIVYFRSLILTRAHNE